MEKAVFKTSGVVWDEKRNKKQTIERGGQRAKLEQAWCFGRQRHESPGTLDSSS